MSILAPDWSQSKPTLEHAGESCHQITLEPLVIGSGAITAAIEQLRQNLLNGNALVGAFRLGENAAFDWFASRNRLLEYDVLPSLLCRGEVRNTLPELCIPSTVEASEGSGSCSTKGSFGLELASSFLFDGHLAQLLFGGGVYPPATKVDGRTAKRLALDFCQELFGLRYEEVSFYTSHDAWSPWFRGIAWDWTAVLLNKRTRSLWVLAVTDED